MTTAILKALTIATLALVCAACSSSLEVRELAQTTASNASLINTQLAGFSQNTRRIAERRAEAAAELSEEVEVQQAKFEAFLEGARASARIAGQAKQPNFATLVEELQRVSEAIRARQEAAQGQRAAVREEILSSQSSLSFPKQNLATITKMLGELAKEPTREEQLAFLKGFFAQVVAEIREARSAAEEAGQSAEQGAGSANDAAKEEIEGTSKG